MQNQEHRQDGDARLNHFAGKGVWLFTLAVAAIVAILIVFFLMTAVLRTSETGTRVLSIDFRVFWAAAQLAFAGEPLAAFDMQRLDAVHGLNDDDWMPWLYPPGYLVLITPLGAMLFHTAYALMTSVSVLVIGLAVWPFVGGNRPLWIALTLAPAYIPALLLGQNSVVWVAGLLAGLAALRSGRPLLAGVFIGCLTLKPQLGLLIPVALLAVGAWQTIFAASVTAVLLAALPTLSYGLEYWSLLAERLAEHGQRMTDDIENLDRIAASVDLMVGPYLLLVLAGVPPELALKAQWILTAILAVAVTLAWRIRMAGFDVKVAFLLTAMLLSAPYFWFYEAALMPTIGLFMLRAGILTTRPLHILLLMLLWLGGGLQAMAILLGFGKQAMLGAFLITPALIAVMATCVAHLIAPNPTDRHPTPTLPSL